MFAGENKTLLIGGNAFFVLDLCLDIFNGVARLYLKCDGLSRYSFDKNLKLRWRGVGECAVYKGWPVLPIIPEQILDCKIPTTVVVLSCILPKFNYLPNTTS